VLYIFLSYLFLYYFFGPTADSDLTADWTFESVKSSQAKVNRKLKYGCLFDQTKFRLVLGDKWSPLLTPKYAYTTMSSRIKGPKTPPAFEAQILLIFKNKKILVQC
jgi:hypothetical protein